jgi:hypothetical protein
MGAALKAKAAFTLGAKDREAKEAIGEEKPGHL